MTKENPAVWMSGSWGANVVEIRPEDEARARNMVGLSYKLYGEDCGVAEHVGLVPTPVLEEWRAEGGALELVDLDTLRELLGLDD